MYANVFNILKFELNPLDNKKDIGLYVLFQDISGQFSGIHCISNCHLPFDMLQE